MIAQRPAAALMLDEVENGLFHAGIAERFTCRSLITGCEKIFHLENAVRRGHVFAGNGAADRGLVYPHSIGNFCHRHRFQMRRAMLKEIPLPRNDLLRDVQNCLLALMDRADQEFAAADFVADIIFDVPGLRVSGGDDVLVEIADPQMRNLFVVEGDLIFAIHFFDDDVRRYVILWRGSENLTWPRVQARDVVGGLLYLFDADCHPARNLGKAVLGEFLHVLRNNGVLEAVFFSLAPQLNQQTLAQITRTNSRRIKGLNQRQCPFEIVLWNS